MRRKPVIVALGTLLVGSVGPPAAGVEQAVPVVEPSKPDVVKSVNGTNAPLVPASAPKTPVAGPAAVSWPKSAAEVVTTSKPSMVSMRGLSISVRRTDGAVVRGPVRLTVDYSRFRDAFGADWASRLRLVSRDGSPASGVRNDLRSGKLSGDVSLGAAEEQFVVAAAPEGSTGDYKATSLSPAGKWQVATNTGAFTWSYGLRTPPVPGELGPGLAVSYNSNAVDGRTASTNSQPSWVGEGWNLWPGFIERSYKGCAEDLGGNNGQTKTGDLCWETENATMSFGSHSGQLVLGSGGWRLKDDDGTRIEPVGGHWKVTTTDGTQYFFGRRADSAWTVPVFGNDPGEPCHQPTFDASQCDQVYRWNLDYIVDRHGNSMSYFYREETNLYGANLAARGSSYTRGGTLERIEYGTRDGEAGQAPARVLFDVADRCSSNCGVHNATSWPDVPWDQECTSGTCSGKVSPTFWSTKRLAKVTTQVSTGGGNYRGVDQWDFAHTFPVPGDGTTGSLWLTSITMTGLAATPAITLPPVTFEGTMVQNRVNTDADGPPKLNKNRITTIKNEAGGQVNVHYAAPDCVDGGAPPTPDANATRCFPVRWAMPPAPEPRDDWFHKYIVTRIVEDDRVGGAPEVGNKKKVTNYDYLGGGAWAYDDNPLITPDKRTWSDWRGYEKVVVREGDPANDENKPESWTQHQYFRGMHGDKLRAGGTKTVDIGDSRGTRIADEPQYAGFERETIVKNSGTEVTGAIHTPWSRLTATQGSLKAHQVENAKSEARTRLSDGSNRNTRIETTYDEYGNPLAMNDAGDLASTTDDRCTTTTYAKNTATMVVNLPSEVKTIGVACGSTPSFPEDAITDTRTYYDNGSLGAQPSKGDKTRTETAKGYSGGTATYLQNSAAVPDKYGRALEGSDALRRKTTTSYVETNGLTTSTTVTNPLGHAATTTVDAAWGVPTRVVDANGRTTSLQYDALGRLVTVWKPGRTEAAGDSPHLRYTYEVRNNGTSWVKSEALKANLNFVGTYSLLDGFLRERQTQAPSPQGGRIVTDTLHDSRGLVSVTRAPYYHKDAPPGTALFIPNAGEVPNATVKVYDGAERETDSIYMKLNVEQWRTRTYHGGDRVSVVPPPGGTATTTFTDARGRTTSQQQYRVRPASGPPTGVSDRTAYGHTKRGELASITDPAGNVWRYDYDVLGRKVRSDDPDHGVSKMVYDDAGQLLMTTDARGKTLVARYDDLGRKIETRLGSDTGALVTSLVYDSLAKGALTSSTRYIGGAAYTTSITGYDPAGRPKGERVSIPAVEAELAGTYPTEMTYAVDGSPATVKLPALGSGTSMVAAETLVYGYDDLGQPDTAIGAAPYVTDTRYTALGEPTQIERGIVGKRLWQTTYREDGTRRTTRVLTEREHPTSKMTNDLQYAYDPTGNVTKITDRTVGSTADTQCFGYDYLRRVTAAWTAIDDCAAAPTPSLIGGPAPYWHQYAYDLTGNRKMQTRKGLGGAADQVSTYAYPNGGDGVDLPHAVSSIQTGAHTDTYGYDPAGNTITRPGPSGPQALGWDDEGQLASITSGPSTTSYVYDADGEQLIRRDPGSITLFVGGGQIVLDTTTKTRTGTRYYDKFGMRTSAGLNWLVADRHGTSQVAVKSGDLTATPRRLDLFGNPRGAIGAAATAAWPGGDRGFVDGNVNTSTGLTRLGAREYDPATGRFISVDPLSEPGNPQQMNAYSYSNNNPTTFSDPSGLFCDSCDYYDYMNPTGVSTSAWAPTNKHGVKRPTRVQERRTKRATLHDWDGADGKRGHVAGERWRKPVNLPRIPTLRGAPDDLNRMLEDARKLIEDGLGGPIKSGSICAEGHVGMGAGTGVDMCMNFDAHGATVSSQFKFGFDLGVEAYGAVVIKLNSQDAAGVSSWNGGPGTESSFGPEGSRANLRDVAKLITNTKVKAGWFAGAEWTGDQDNNTSLAIKIGYGAGVSLGGYYGTMGVNSGHVKPSTLITLISGFF